MSLRAAYRNLCLSQTQQNYFIEQFEPNKQIYKCTDGACQFQAKIQPTSLNYEIINAHTCVPSISQLIGQQEQIPSSFHEGEIAILTFSYDEIFSVALKSGETFQNRYGAFDHQQILAKGPGVKIISTNQKSHCFALRATPNLSAICLMRQTQILFQQDAAFVCQFVKPGDVVAEAGVGSGAVTLRLLERVGSAGMLFGYDVDEERVLAVQNKCDAWKQQFGYQCQALVQKQDVANGFLGVPDNTLLDFVFLDLPEPKFVVNSLIEKMSKGATFVVFVPCVEQITAFIEAGNRQICCRKVVKVMSSGYEFDQRILPAPMIRRQFKGSKDSTKYESLREVQEQRTHTGYLCVCSVCKDICE